MRRPIQAQPKLATWWSIALVAGLLGFESASAKDPPPSVPLRKSTQTIEQITGDIPAESRWAIDSAASLLADGRNQVDVRLVEIGYAHPGIPSDTWTSLTPHAKLEAAYISAEAGSPGGGERMLALMSRSLALEYEPVRSDPHLRSYAEQLVSLDSVKFATIEAQDGHSSERVPHEARLAIDAMTNYCDGGGFGPRTVLTEYFSLEADKANEILRTSRTNQEALERGYLAASAERRTQGMQELVTHLDASYESARGMKEFQPFRSTAEPPPITKQVVPETRLNYSIAEMERALKSREGEYTRPRRGAFSSESSPNYSARDFGSFGSDYSDPFERLQRLDNPATERPYSERSYGEHGYGERSASDGAPSEHYSGRSGSGFGEHSSRATGILMIAVFVGEHFGPEAMIATLVVLGSLWFLGVLSSLFGGKSKPVVAPTTSALPETLPPIEPPADETKPEEPGGPLDFTGK